MLSSILQGFILGFVLTAIPGAVFLETARRALGRLSVVSFLAGNFVGVGITIAVTFLGLSSLLKETTWSHVFYLLSGATLVYIGVASLASKKLSVDKKTQKRTPSRIHPHSTAFLAGLILAIANPVSILFWITMIGRYFNNHDHFMQVAANCVAIVLGTAVFYALLLYATRMTHRVLSERHLTALSDVFGALILIYGGFVIFKVL